MVASSRAPPGRARDAAGHHLRDGVRRHALPAFEVQALDYLLKPVRTERLLDALKRAHRLKRNEHGSRSWPARWAPAAAT